MAIGDDATAIGDGLGIPIETAALSEEDLEPLGKLAPIPSTSEPPPPAPTGGPSDPQLVNLERLTVTVSGATSIKYFAIQGSSPSDLIADAEREAQSHCGRHAAACVKPRWAVWRVVQGYDSEGRCIITEFAYKAAYTVWILQWTRPSRVYPEPMAWWEEVLDHIAWHERQHIKIQNGLLDDLSPWTGAPSCSKFQDTVNAWYRRLNRAQDNFDDRERSWIPPPYFGP